MLIRFLEWQWWSKVAFYIFIYVIVFHFHCFCMQHALVLVATPLYEWTVIISSIAPCLSDKLCCGGVWPLLLWPPHLASWITWCRRWLQLPCHFLSLESVCYNNDGPKKTHPRWKRMDSATQIDQSDMEFLTSSGLRNIANADHPFIILNRIISYFSQQLKFKKTKNAFNLIVALYHILWPLG